MQVRLIRIGIFVLLIAALCALGGCSAKNAARPTSIVLDPNQGWIVGSFTLTNDHTDRRHIEHGSIRVGIGGTTLERKNAVTLTKNDFDDERSRGFVFAIALPPGENAFSSVATYDNTGYSESSWSDASFWVPFQVEANRVTYVGEVMFTSDMAANLLGMRVITRGGWLTFSDQSARDLPLIDARFPALRQLQRVSDVPRAAKSPNPSVRFE